MLASSLSKPPAIQPYAPQSSLWTDLQVLYHMLFANVKGDTQQDRLESFYLLQADLYDSYRHRMLHARLPMIQSLPLSRGGTWVDLGGGTGSNLEYFGEQGLRYWGRVVVLDLCPSLVKTATQRVRSHAPAWDAVVSVVLGDACDFDCKGLPPAGTVDVVTFSYALSMIPDWRKAIRNAYRLLKPGGHIAVCDFTVSAGECWLLLILSLVLCCAVLCCAVLCCAVLCCSVVPVFVQGLIAPLLPHPHAAQNSLLSMFWTWMFANDHVHLRAEHIPTLQMAFDTVHLHQGFGTFPYVPGCLKAPWFAFVGQKVSDRPCPDLLG